MGYLPKHIKVRRHNGAMLLIAMAGLSGATFTTQPRLNFQDGDEYSVGFPDGHTSCCFCSKSTAAAHYLIWWFQKQDMLFPKRRIA